jgi:hypothetical protein|uniref:B30.2/SPRY domain-containing protein n=1 Tax=viral metagenome TaxID=1070528 RepID=A0A6C0ECT7_9ZZZZ
MNFLKFNEIINKSKENNLFSKIYLENLFNYFYNNILHIRCEQPLLAIKSFIPLPSKLLLNENYINTNLIVFENNEYKFLGTNGNRNIFSNIILPFIDSNIDYPIPFTFYIYSNDSNNNNYSSSLPLTYKSLKSKNINNQYIDIISSNIYYYELTIKYDQNINNFDMDEYISIGFGNKNLPINARLGSTNDSFGFNSDGSIVINYYVDLITDELNKKKSKIDKIFLKKVKKRIISKISTNWIPGDTIGAGIIYVDINKIKPFFTLNGKLIYMSNIIIELMDLFCPIIGYNHSHSIDLNFSTKKFEFDIKNLISQYSDNIISTNNSFINNYNIEPYLNIQSNKIVSNKFYNSILNYINMQNNFINSNGEIINNQNIDESNTLLDINEIITPITIIPLNDNNLDIFLDDNINNLTSNIIDSIKSIVDNLNN